MYLVLLEAFFVGGIWSCIVVKDYIHHETPLYPYLSSNLEAFSGYDVRHAMFFKLDKLSWSGTGMLLTQVSIVLALTARNPSSPHHFNHSNANK
jgi:hypothetical protein